MLAAVCGCSQKSVARVADAYPRGCGLEYATRADLRSLGLSPPQAARLHGAFELARHVAQTADCRIGAIQSPADVSKFLGRFMGHLDQESFVVILLDGRQQVIDIREVARGAIAQVDVHPREVFREAVRLRAHSLIVAHNHPSGDAAPSAADVELTHRLAEVGRTLGIPILDSMVVARQGGDLKWVSMAELGLVHG